MASQTEPEDTEKLWAEEQLKLRTERARKAKAEARLSIPYSVRLLLATSLSFMAGGGLGVSHGAQQAGLRFRAENAHRLPNSQAGWYFYHKSKNYNMALGGVKEGLKMGARISFWTAGFFAIEELFDRYRRTKDFLNTVLASLVVSGSFSLWNRFPVATAARTARTGLAIGLAYGLVEDALGAANGRRPGYVDFLVRDRRRSAKAEVSAEGEA
ncbi:hypothetical protein LCER1_G003327 [Lachnellula cervina]|uniref:Uncharacterized protein n=1 Tax=Lachnellula cervina TaxID=1316786 RepID=A0A7D8YR11_9HELO|nr:hypothetical protein LCER1_G003327 [Lachnellula cervina]